MIMTFLSTRDDYEFSLKLSVYVYPIMEGIVS